MEAAKATANWWDNDPVADDGKVKVPDQDPRITALQEPGGAQRLLRGVPILGGALDEIGAGADAALDYVSGGRIGEPYDVGLERRRQAIRKSDAENPVRNTIEAVAGGVATAAAVPVVQPFRGNNLLSAAGNGGINALLAAAPTGFTEGEGGFAERLDNAQDYASPAVVAGTVLGTGGQALANRLTPTRPNSVVPQAQSLGITLPAFMEGAQATQNFGSKLAAIPFVGDDINSAVRTARDQTTEAAQRLSTSLTGNNASTVNAGEAARDALTNWADDGARAVQDRVYAPVNQAMQNVVAPLNNTRQAAATLAAQQDAAASPLHQRAIAEVTDALQRPQGLAFDGLTRLRTRIGAMIDNSVDPENRTARAGLQAVYAGLTQDMEAAVAQQGGARAQALWQRANGVTRQVAERREAVAKLVGANGDKPGEGIIDKIVSLASTKSSADSRRLGQARRIMGADAWRQVAENSINRLGRNQSNQFSPDIFLKNFSQLSDDGRRLLYQSTGDDNLLPALNNLAAVSERLQRFNRLGNASGSGGVAALIAALGGFASGASGPTLATVVGGRLAGVFLSRPAIVRNISAHAQNMQRALNDPRAKAALAATATNLARSVAEVTGEDEAEILKRLPSP